MKLKFDRDARLSLATEIKKVSTFGGIGLGFFGYTENSPLLLLAACVWWIICQAIAHVIMSIQDKD